MTHTAPTVSKLTVTFALNKNAIMTICGVAISSNYQYVAVTVYKGDVKVEADNGVKYDLQLQGKNETMEFNPSANNVDVYGPYDEDRKIKLEFSHGGDDSDYKEQILTDKAKSLTDEDGTTRVDMITYDNGYTENKEVNDCLVTVFEEKKTQNDVVTKVERSELELKLKFKTHGEVELERQTQTVAGRRWADLKFEIIANFVLCRIDRYSQLAGDGLHCADSVFTGTYDPHDI
ncbi:hypothetical protein GALMADRAFT_138601 [Galerina marginata CBS 339.88]|uniref:Uncharacterized protein n=1 Tax=Galerina marginata (strain CBS 339.88) TaxID=685588 RepID=A0A067TC96_GALM3|nr:hypothetical protein GALMADRAFT_138601 [Galerina marginata CBS 339.88]